MLQRRRDNAWGIIQLWVNWLIGSGAISLIIILSLWVKALYLPFLAFGFQLVLVVLMQYNRSRRAPSCYILPYVVSRSLFWTGVIMVALNFLYSSPLLDIFVDRNSINADIPFITVLIISPVTALVAGLSYLNRHKLVFCRDCKITHGTPAERGFLGMIYTQVGTYQIGMLFWLMAVSALIGWVYYALLYVNVSLSVPDRFVFFWLPTMLWIACALYLMIRYAGIYGYYRQNVEGSIARHGSSSLIRFLIIHGNTIAIKPPQEDSDMKLSLDERFDTPVEAYMRHREKFPESLATECFANITGVANASARFIYCTRQTNVDRDIFHFFVFADDDQKRQLEQRFPDLLWLSLIDVAELINDHLTNPMLSAEITRIHAIASTYKRFDRKGCVRYKVKDYKPQVKISDLKDLDVDFNDPIWLHIAHDNQTTRFHRLRRFWRRYVTGIGS